MRTDDLFEGLDTERMHLRCVRRNDAATVARLMTSVSRWLASWPSLVTEQSAAEKILEARKEIAAGRALHFILERRADGEVMGWIRINYVPYGPTH